MFCTIVVPLEQNTCPNSCATIPQTFKLLKQLFVQCAYPRPTFGSVSLNFFLVSRLGSCDEQKERKPKLMFFTIKPLWPWVTFVSSSCFMGRFNVFRKIFWDFHDAFGSNVLWTSDSSSIHYQFCGIIVYK